MTLNGLAYQYVTALGHFWAIPYLMPLPGFLMGLVLPDAGRKIARRPHWLAVLGLVLLLTLQQFLWFAMPEAVLQVLPLANLPLLLTASREGTEGEARMLSAWDLPAGVVVVAGLALIGANKGMTSVLQSRLEPMIAETAEDMTFAGKYLRYQIEAQGLPTVIAQVATGQPEPVLGEPGHRILRLGAKGVALHIFHELDAPEAEELDAAYRRALVSDTCQGLAWLLDAGGTVSRHFARKNYDWEFEVLNIRHEDCLV